MEGKEQKNNRTGSAASFICPSGRTSQWELDASTCPYHTSLNNRGSLVWNQWAIGGK
jgi:hypothetical protein